MRAILIDDEESARERLRRMLRAHPEVAIAGEARDGLEAVQKIEELRPDLVFLDIEMPGLNGFQVLRSLPRGMMPLVIFATGYDQHALAAFDANALAYLLKPVEADRLAAAMERAQKLSASGGGKEREHILDVVRGTPAMLRQIVCRKRDRMLLVQPEQILWFQVEDGIVKAHTATETYWVNHALSELETSLPGDVFFRARREALVNMGKVKEIRPYFKSAFLLIMDDASGTQIAVSERQARLLRLRIPGL